MKAEKRDLGNIGKKGSNGQVVVQGLAKGVKTRTGRVK